MKTKNLLGKLLLGLSGICAINSTQATDYTWTAGATANWASSNWAGTPAVNASTGPVGTDNAFFAQGTARSTRMNGARAINDATSTATAGWTLEGGSALASTLIANSISNIGSSVLQLRNGDVTGTLDVTTTNLTLNAGSGGTLTLGGTALAETNGTWLYGLTVLGQTTVANGTVNINIRNTNNEYSLGLLNITTGSILLNRSFFTKNTVVNLSGLSGAGGTLSGATAVSGTNTGTSSMVITATSNYSSGASLQDGSGSLRLTKSGAGTQTLSGSSSYSGGTTITAGTLLITSTNGAGTGAVSVAAGTLHVNALSGSGAIANAVTITNNNGEYILERANGTNLAAFAASSDIAGGQDTVASILSGTASTARTLTSGFDTAPSVSATNDGDRASDVFSLEGTGTDIFVLQLQIADVAAGQYLGWLNGSDTWVNAVAGNSSTGGSAVTNFAGSFAASTAQATADYLGSWGYDTSANTVWAVLDHNSEFAVVPEPSAVFLVVAGLGMLALCGAKRRKLAGMR